MHSNHCTFLCSDLFQLQSIQSGWYQHLIVSPEQLGMHNVHLPRLAKLIQNKHSFTSKISCMHIDEALLQHFHPISYPWWRRNCPYIPIWWKYSSLWTAQTSHMQPMLCQPAFMTSAISTSFFLFSSICRQQYQKLLFFMTAKRRLWVQQYTSTPDCLCSCKAKELSNIIIVTCL